MFDLKNKIDYYLRTLTKFSRKNYFEDLELKQAINNYTFDVLSKALKPVSQDNLRVLDIGSKNWEYAKGEYNFFKQFCNNLNLDGVEIDAYRLYSNFYSRYEVAKFYIKDLDGAEYYADNLLNINKKYDYIVWFLPFVTKYPHKRWGLPENMFMPEKLLAHAYKILKKEMLIINQSEEEAKIQQQLLESQNIPYKPLGVIKSNFYEFKNQRYGFVVKKT